MAVTDLASPESGEPLPKRKLDVIEIPEPEVFGVDLSDEEYREELGLYIGRKIIINSTGVRHFKSRHGLTVKFIDDPITLTNELSPLEGITGLPMTYNGEEALVIPWNREDLGGIIKPFVPLDRAVTTIWLPPTQA